MHHFSLHLAILILITTGPLKAQDGLEIWQSIYEVFSHPRCANCHVDDGVPRWSGAHYGEPRAHGMYIGGDPDNQIGAVGAECSVCHAPDNSPTLHGPPGAEVWALAPKEFVWFAKSSAQVCAQIKDPDRNGGRSIAQVAEHIDHDALVHWGWEPGPGREPAPGTRQDVIANLLAWEEKGTPCPES